jgi:hypothetical protein
LAWAPPGGGAALPNNRQRDRFNDETAAFGPPFFV